MNEIRLLEDGNFSIQGDNGWGFSNRKGNFIASPRYKNELKFENGFADISIAGETLKINSNGNILVKNGKESVLLPNIYYWGSNFKNDISIVRSITDAGDRIGVVNVRGEEIIPTIIKMLNCFLTELSCAENMIAMVFMIQKGNVFCQLFS